MEPRCPVADRWKKREAVRRHSVDAMTISVSGRAQLGVVPTLEAADFQEREPLDLPAGVINCTSFN